MDWVRLNMSMISCIFLELLFSVFKIKVTHKECFARQTVKEVGKLKNMESENLFFLLGGGQ